MKHAGVGGCLILGLPVMLLLGFVLILPAIMGASENHTQNAVPSVAACGTSTVNVPDAAVPWMAEAAKTSGLPQAWLSAVASRESGFIPSAFAYDTNGGTWGLFQLNREEWSKVYDGTVPPAEAWANQLNPPEGITDPMIHSHFAGMYFKNRLERVQKMKADNPDAAYAELSDLDALVIAHNAGEGNLAKYPSLPSITRDYLKEIQQVFQPGPCPTNGTPGANELAGVDDYGPWYDELDQSVKNQRWDPLGFAWRQCTSYSAFAVRKYTSYTDFRNFWRGAQFGNANTWDDAAAAVGIRVDQTPAVGAVAQREGGTWGHVAFIVAVNGDGSFVINEYNHVQPRTFSSRTTMIGPGSENFTNILHFEEAS